MTRRITGVFLFVVALMLGGYAIAADSAPPAPSSVSVMAFPGAFNWPLWAGIELGFFHGESVDVELSYTSSSVQQFTEIMAGRQDIIMTAVDNVVAYREGFGEADLQEPSDVVAFMGGDNGFLSFVTQPDVKSYDDLVGKELAVDAMMTGYAFVLRKFVQSGGVDEADINYVSAGGALQRFQKMMGGDFAGSVLMTPFDLMAAAAGFNILNNAGEVLGGYQGVVGATRQSWAEQNSDALIGFIRGYKRALLWLYQRENKQAAIDILEKYFPKLPSKFSESVYQVVLADEGGLEPEARFDEAGLRTVLGLRQEFGPDNFTPSDLQRYYTDDYYEQAAISEQSNTD